MGYKSKLNFDFLRKKTFTKYIFNILIFMCFKPKCLTVCNIFKKKNTTWKIILESLLYILRIFYWTILKTHYDLTIYVFS